jgi:hypothetical protein
MENVKGAIRQFEKRQKKQNKANWDTVTLFPTGF